MWSELSMRHLLAFRAVVEEGTFGRAATRLGFTQSAVSQQVAGLEQLVGQPLLDRPPGPRPPRLTPAGELFLSHVRDLIERVEQAEHDMDRHARGVTGRLVIGTFQSTSARVLPSTLRRLYQEAPDVEVSVLEEDEDQDLRLEMLARGDLDLSFVAGEVPPNVEARFLGSDPHVALVPPDYPAGPVDLHQIAGRPMVGQPADDTCGMEVDRGFERLAITPNYVFRSYDNGAVQGMVGAGVGIAVVPLLTVDVTDPTVSVRATVPVIEPRRLSIVWSAERSLAPIAERFVAIAAEVCAEQLQALQPSV